MPVGLGRRIGAALPFGPLEGGHRRPTLYLLDGDAALRACPSEEADGPVDERAHPILEPGEEGQCTASQSTQPRKPLSSIGPILATPRKREIVAIIPRSR